MMPEKRLFPTSAVQPHTWRLMPVNIQAEEAGPAVASTEDIIDLHGEPSNYMSPQEHALWLPHTWSYKNAFSTRSRLCGFKEVLCSCS